MSDDHDLTRYAALLEHLITPVAPFVPESETDTQLQVERGTIFPLLLTGGSLAADNRFDRLIHLAQHAHLDRIIIVDRHGHRRPFYRGLLIHASLRALQLLIPSPHPRTPRPGTPDRPIANAQQLPHWQAALHAWCTLLQTPAASVPWGTPLPASQGHHIADAAWSALALHTAARLFQHQPWADAARHAFTGLARAQQPDGPFLLATPSDNPETFWYHELLILHAAASYAADARDHALLTAVHRNAEFHLYETQPDHATTQPLALFAFAINPATRLLADQILHALLIQHPAGLPGTATLLLADALSCLHPPPLTLRV